MDHVSREGEPKLRRRTRYRDPMAGLVVLTLLALVMFTVIAVQLRLVTVEVRLGPRLRATAAQATSVSAAAAEPRVTPVKAPRVTKPLLPVAAVDAVDSGDAPLVAETPVTAARNKVLAAAPSKALASAVAKSKQVAECATAITTAVNVDPTEGEISGTTGLPDQVSYFKARVKGGCRSVARTPDRPR